MGKVLILIIWGLALAAAPLFARNLSADYLSNGLLLAFCSLNARPPKVKSIKVTALASIALLSCFALGAMILGGHVFAHATTAGPLSIKLVGMLSFSLWGLLLTTPSGILAEKHRAGAFWNLIDVLTPAVLFSLYTLTFFGRLLLGGNNIASLPNAPSLSPGLAMSNLLLCAATALLAERQASHAQKGDLGFVGSCKLTGRELEVVTLLLSGLSQKEVANSLGIKPSTVGTYRSRAFDKLSVSKLEEIEVISPAKEVPAHATTTRIRTVASFFAFIVIAAGLPAISDILPTIYCPLVCFIVALAAELALIAVASRAHAQDRERKRNAIGCHFCCVCTFLLAVVVRGTIYGYLPQPAFCIPLALACLAMLLRHRSMRGADEHLCDGCCVAPLATFVLGMCFAASPAAPETIFVGGLISVNLPTLYAVSSLILSFCLVVVCYLYQLRGRRAEPGASETVRSVLYLRGRGLGELEAQAASLIARGFPNDTICEFLHISPGTLNSYRFRTYSILGIHSRTELKEILDRDVGGGS